MTVPQRHSRQQFLGPKSEVIFRHCRVAIVGLGGGGSHIAQQLAHVGIGVFELFDGECAEMSNLNRLVGAGHDDAKAEIPKVEIARKMVLRINPDALVGPHQCRWQEAALALRSCDAIFGCVDSYQARRDLEAAARRFCIPYLDVGMDVHAVAKGFTISGQVILSLPGGPCMWCLGFLTEENISQEASAYGAAGPRPQVVWSNGVLASTAVALFLEMVTGWTGRHLTHEYLTYDGTRNLLTPHPRRGYAPEECPHYPLSQTGEPIWVPIKP